MIIYSEILDKAFDSVDSCLQAEAEYKVELKKKEEEEKVRKEELDKAYAEAIAACDRYLEWAGFVVEKETDIDNDNDDETAETAETAEIDDLSDIFKDIVEIILG